MFTIEPHYKKTCGCNAVVAYLFTRQTLLCLAPIMTITADSSALDPPSTMVPWTIQASNSSKLSVASEHAGASTPRQSSGRDPTEGDAIMSPTTAPRMLRKSSSCSELTPQVNTARLVRQFFVGLTWKESQSSEDLRENLKNSGRHQTKRDDAVHASLKAKVAEVKACVRKTRDALRVVQDNVLRVDLSPEDLKHLYDEWLDIMKTFEEALSNSRMSAMDVSQIITEFLDVVIPRLKSEDNALKIREATLNQYQGAMNDGKSFAGEIVKKFATLNDRIILFKAACSGFAPRLLKGLKAKIKKSGQELSKLKTCFKAVITGFTSIVSGGASKAITVIRENAQLAISNVDILRGLWELVEMEIRRIKTSLTLTVDAKLWTHEVQLLEKLRNVRQQYETLQGCLNDYALALVT